MQQSTYHNTTPRWRWPGRICYSTWNEFFFNQHANVAACNIGLTRTTLSNLEDLYNNVVFSGEDDLTHRTQQNSYSGTCVKGGNRGVVVSEKPARDIRTLQNSSDKLVDQTTISNKNLWHVSARRTMYTLYAGWPTSLHPFLSITYHTAVSQ